MMNSRAGIALFALFLAACSGDREPSEKEMKAALKVKFDAINAELRSVRDMCERREFNRNGGDPMMAMQCLVQYGASGGSGNLQYDITRFEKLGCGKATGQAGYMCDYNAGFSTNSPVMQGQIARMMGRGGVSKGRFLKGEEGWIFLPAN